MHPKPNPSVLEALVAVRASFLHSSTLPAQLLLNAKVEHYPAAVHYVQDSVQFFIGGTFLEEVAGQNGGTHYIYYKRSIMDRGVSYHDQLLKASSRSYTQLHGSSNT